MGFVDPLDKESGVLLLEPMEPSHQLVLVALGLGPDGDGQGTGSDGTGRTDDRNSLRGQGVSGDDVGQLGHGHDVARPAPRPLPSSPCP